MLMNIIGFLDCLIDGSYYFLGIDVLKLFENKKLVFCNEYLGFIF